MPRNDLNASQKRILEAISDPSTVKYHKDANGFDFPCINDFCCGRTEESREDAIAWKTKTGYKVFCYSCGEESDLSKEELKFLKDKISKEEQSYNLRKQKEESELRIKKLDEYENDYYDIECNNSEEDQ